MQITHSPYCHEWEAPHPINSVYISVLGEISLICVHPTKPEWSSLSYEANHLYTSTWNTLTSSSIPTHFKHDAYSNNQIRAMNV